MPRDTENAIRVAILYKPELFGLVPEDINPMLMYVNRCLEEGDEYVQDDAWQHCFNAVNTTLHEKVVEVLTGLAVVQNTTQKNAIAEHSEEDVPAKPSSSKSKSSKHKSVADSEIKGSPGRELSHKQLRYMGYLHRQLGEEPDYTVISKLSQKAATLRIKELEARVKG